MLFENTVFKKQLGTYLLDSDRAIFFYPHI